MLRKESARTPIRWVNDRLNRRSMATSSTIADSSQRLRRQFRSCPLGAGAGRCSSTKRTKVSKLSERLGVQQEEVLILTGDRRHEERSFVASQLGTNAVRRWPH